MRSKLPILALIALVCLIKLSSAQTVTVDGSLGPITVDSDTTHTYVVTGGQPGNTITVIYCPGASYSGSCFNCSSCSGTFSGSGTFSAVDCLYNSWSSPFTFYVGYVDGGNPGNQWVSVTINPGAGCSNAITGIICNVYFTVDDVLLILSLALLMLGGIIYASSHIMPGQSRGVLQAYSWAILLGGVGGLVISVVGPWMLSTITGNSIAQILAVCP